MDLPDAARANSKVFALYRTIQQSLPQWLESSTVVAMLQQITVAEPSGEKATWPSETGEEASEHEGPDSESQSSIDESESSSAFTASDAAWWKNSGIYSLLQAAKQYAYASWLYRWLTDEPDPAVVVIDLRETLALGPLLARLETAIRNTVAVVPTSGGIRRGFHLRARFRNAPIRVLSFGLIGGVLLAFIPLVAAGRSIGLATFLLCGLLVLGLRGTQSTVPWSQIQDTDWYKTVAAVFEPPAPPADGALSDSSEANVEPATDQDIGADEVEETESKLENDE